MLQSDPVYHLDRPTADCLQSINQFFSMLERATLHYGNCIHGTDLQDQCSFSDIHLLTHQTRKLEGGHFSLVTLSDVEDTQISVVSVTLKAEEITVVFFSNRLHLSISCLQQEAIFNTWLETD